MTEEEAHAAKHAATLVTVRGGIAQWTIQALVRDPDGIVRATLYRPNEARGYRRYHVRYHVSLARLELAS